MVANRADADDRGDSPTDRDDDRSIDRRSYLQLLGTATASVAAVSAGSDAAQAAPAGYGKIQFGAIDYGEQGRN